MFDRQKPRPTLRVIREDLVGSFTEPWVDRENKVHDLLPLPELPHPILKKATEFFKDGQIENLEVIQSSPSSFRLRKLRLANHRTAIWIDEHGTPWICKYGLSKGAHTDRDDFYREIERLPKEALRNTLEPTSEDKKLLRREEANHILHFTELKLQRDFTEKLNTLYNKIENKEDKADATISFPNLGEIFRTYTKHNKLTDNQPSLGKIKITLERDPSLKAIILIVELPTNSNDPSFYTLRDLIMTLSERRKDKWETIYDGIFERIFETPEWEEHLADINAFTARNERIDALPPTSCHYTHKRSQAEAIINGTAQRALCGVFFVPSSDPVNFDPCPICEARYQQLPE